MSFDTDTVALLDKLRSVIVPSTDVLLGTALAALAVVAGLTVGGVVQALLGLLLVLYLQGYAVVAALFPGHPTASDGWFARRVALPFGVSLALLPPLGLAFALLELPFSAGYVLGVTGGLTVVGLLVAGRRRVHRSPDGRADSPVGELVGAVAGRPFERPTTELLVNALTLVAVVTAMAGLVFAVVAPAPGSQYARFSVLTQNESGDLVASDYPTEFTTGEGQEVVVEIANRGPSAERYTVLVQLQRFDAANDSVTERSRLRRLNQSVAAGETWTRPLTVTPDVTGQRLRLAFLLYPADPPAFPTMDSAEEHLFLWVNVTGPGGPTNGSQPVTTPSTVPSDTPTATPNTPTATPNTSTATPNTSTPTPTPSAVTTPVPVANESTDSPTPTPTETGPLTPQPGPDDGTETPASTPTFPRLATP